jgi:predicted CXXCH cytochrome family protein
MLKKLAGLTAIAGLFIAGTASAQGIASSAHDFSDDTGWNDTGEICKVCHIPHMTTTAVDDAPLWNHTQTTATGFTPYSNPATMDATMAQPTGISLLCLSCHDGTVALDSFGGNGISPGVLIGSIDGGRVDVTKDLSNDHPISITYNLATQADMNDPTATVSGLGNNVDDDLLFGTGNDQVECASCHDVHDDAGNPFLLVVSNAGSALCQTCHGK